MPEFRKDPVVDRWVIIAAERGQRPQEDFPEDGRSARPDCPFCAGNEAMTPPAVLVLSENSAVQDAPWTVRVVPNKYPALHEHGVYALRENGLYISAEAAGVHEVIIESATHISEFSALSAAAIERLLQAYRERLRCLRADGWQYALIYKNQGREAGATLSHGHSQIAALPMVPVEVRHEVAAANTYYATNGRCIYCDLLARERADGARLVLDTGTFMVFCPFAARAAGETWIMPSRHSSSFDLTDASELSGLAALLRDFFGRLGTRFEHPAFNFFVHCNPLQEPENPAYHWHLEILPKLQSAAGFEWGSGMYMNSLAPEDAARRLRDR
jgi:UDPglucose--hexose-1-phosphate uridylyltransferase